MKYKNNIFYNRLRFSSIDFLENAKYIGDINKFKFYSIDSIDFQMKITYLYVIVKNYEFNITETYKIHQAYFQEYNNDYNFECYRFNKEVNLYTSIDKFIIDIDNYLEDKKRTLEEYEKRAINTKNSLKEMNKNFLNFKLENSEYLI